MASLFDYTDTNKALLKLGSDFRLPEPEALAQAPQGAVMSATSPSTNQANLTAATAQAAPPPAPPPTTTVTVQPAQSNDPGAPATEKVTPSMPSTEKPGAGMQLASSGAQMASDYAVGQGGVMGRIGSAVGAIINAYSGNYGGALKGAVKTFTG